MPRDADRSRNVQKKLRNPRNLFGKERHYYTSFETATLLFRKAHQQGPVAVSENPFAVLSGDNDEDDLAQKGIDDTGHERKVAKEEMRADHTSQQRRQKATVKPQAGGINGHRRVVRSSQDVRVTDALRGKQRLRMDVMIGVKQGEKVVMREEEDLIGIEEVHIQ